MFYNYLKTALRNFQREKFFTVINLVGLSFGLAVSLTIFIYIYQQFQYDNFHPKVESTFRLGTHLALGGKEGYLNGSHPALSSALKEANPAVEHASRVELRNGVVFQVEDVLFEENKIAYVDQDFFSIFGFEWKQGNRDEALTRPSTVVLTPELAQKYFGSENAVGESILINRELFEITGIIEEAPFNSHLKYQALVSLKNSGRDKDLSWDNINLSTYISLNNTASKAEIEQMVQNTFQDQSGYDPENSNGMLIEYFAQPISDIHLHSNIDGEFEANGSISTIYLFAGIAIVILVLACVNFMNLATARSMYRAKEVGVRKVMGSSRGSLRRQFLVESVFMTSVSMILALGITELLRLPLSSILGEQFGIINVLGFTEALVLILFTVLIGVLAGSYPALFMSSFSPVSVLKGRLDAGSRGRRLRNTLVILQFIISCTLITATLLFNRQVQYLRTQSLGFDKENVIEVKNAHVISDQDIFIERLKQQPGIRSVSFSSSGPIGDYDGTQVHKPSESDRLHLVNINSVNYSYLETMGMKLLEGRDFNKDLSGDSIAVILNKTAADMIFYESAIDGELMFKGGTVKYRVIGVVEDFNFESLRKTIMPLMFFNRPRGRTMEVRLEPGDYSVALSAIENSWKEVASDTPFNYVFVDEQYESLYKTETQTGNLIAAFTFIAVLIACLGLLGLAAYMTERRNKEIGVRKALGASVSSIVMLLSTDFMKIVMIGFIVSIPVTWYLIDLWLQNYAYKIDTGFLTYAIGGIIALILAIGTISYQSIKAALENPIKTLKDE